MSESLIRLQDLDCANIGAPAGQKKVLETASKLGYRFAEDVLNLFRFCNGIDFYMKDLEFLSLEAAVKELEVCAFHYEEHAHLKPLPVFREWSTSNVYCSISEGPAYGYLLCSNLGDHTTLAFRGVEELADLTYETIEKGKFEIPSPFTVSQERSTNDNAVARTLIAAARPLSDDPDATVVNGVRWHFLTFAIQLLPASEVETIAGFLVDNSLVRMQALARLKQIGDLSAQQFLEEDKRHLEKVFIEICNVLTAANIETEPVVEGATSVRLKAIKEHIRADAWIGDSTRQGWKEKLVRRTINWLSRS